MQDSGDPAAKDRRTRAQQLLHAMIECAKYAARSGDLSDNGGLRPQLLVTVSLKELQEGFGSALVPHSGPAPVKRIRKIACDAGIIPIVLGCRGEILNVRRSQRTVPKAIRRALHARDKGCIFSSCTRPGRWTEAHHIIHWADGGDSSIANSCLLCAFHHALIHHSDWEIQMIAGIPWFIPPISLDYLRRPRRNHYHDPLPQSG